MLRNRLSASGGAVLLACGWLILLQLETEALVASAHAQSREVSAGLWGRGTAPRPDWPSWGSRDAALQNQRATRELHEARGVLALGRIREGRRRLEVLVARYPDTVASDQARGELARLYAVPADGARALSTYGRSRHGPGGLARDEGGSHTPVSLGGSAAVGTVIPAQGGRTDETYLPRAATQDFRLHVGDRVFFDERSAELSSQARALLAAQARWLKQVPQVQIVVEGHADDEGGAAFNQDLATHRAEAVRDHLVAEGVEAGRIKLESHGRQRPVALCSDGQCAAQNRRAVTILRGVSSAAENVAPVPDQAARPGRDGR